MQYVTTLSDWNVVSRLSVHFHIAGYDDVALEEFLKYTATLAKQVGYSVDGRVALPTTTEKISIVKPRDRFHEHVIGVYN